MYGANIEANTGDGSAIGVMGVTTTGSITSFVSVGVYGDSNFDNTANRYGVLCRGRFYCTGNSTILGTKSAAVPTDGGMRLVYSVL